MHHLCKYGCGPKWVQTCCPVLSTYRYSALSNLFVQNHIRCMCEAQRALQLVMESIPATRWSKHCKHVMELCWNVLRMRHEEVLVDITFLTAAKYFNLILPLNNQSMRKRLNRHLLHFYVTLLRTAATDHDHVLLFEAVHTMLPYMDVYNVSVGNEDGPMGPTYVNYVRKTIMDQLESLNPPGTTPLPASLYGHLVKCSNDACFADCCPGVEAAHTRFRPLSY